MKYIVMLGDGMADHPLKEIGGKTPLDVAVKPYIDNFAKKGVVGIVKTVPDGMKPGSDVANLGAMGYDPFTCYTGRSPLEAVSMGIKMSDTDVAIRCNLVTLSDEPNYADKTMVDYSSGEITSEESKKIIETVQEKLGTDIFHYYNGISYRHCLIWHNGKIDLDLTPPHDISKRKITEHLPKQKELREMMEKSYDILKDHPVNLDRIKRGLNPANSIWLWGEGTRPAVENFYEKFGVKGSVISAVDLIKGIGISAGMNSIDVEGATGNLKTNFKGKGEAALKELTENGADFVYIHVEAPDECGHQADLPGKIKSIELIDKEIVGPLTEGLRAKGEDFSILILPDHPTPVELMTHVAEPVPFVYYNSTDEKDSGVDCYCESAAKATGLYLDKGFEVMSMLLGRK